MQNYYIRQLYPINAFRGVFRRFPTHTNQKFSFASPANGLSISWIIFFKCPLSKAGSATARAPGPIRFHVQQPPSQNPSYVTDTTDLPQTPSIGPIKTQNMSIRLLDPYRRLHGLFILDRIVVEPNKEIEKQTNMFSNT